MSVSVPLDALAGTTHDHHFATGSSGSDTHVTSHERDRGSHREHSLTVEDSEACPQTENSPVSSSQSPPSSFSTSLVLAVAGAPLHVQAGLIGRGTVVLPLTSPAQNSPLLSQDKGLVAKISWQPLNHLPESAILRHVLRLVRPRWRTCITDMRYSAAFTEEESNLPRTRIIVTAREHHQAKAGKTDEFEKAFDTFVESEVEARRVLRVLVSVRYLPFNQVMNADEFKIVFKDVVKGSWPPYFFH